MIMSPGILNGTGTNMTILREAVNGTSFGEVAVNVNQGIYGGWLFFILLLTLAVILFIMAEKREHQVMTNAMYSMGAVAVVALVLRAIEIIRHGLIQGLVSDYQMWIFPLVACILIIVNWASKHSQL